MNDRATHRAAVEAGYADLAGYVAKYGNEPEYPGESIRTVRMVWPSTGELGEVRLMDYGSGSKKRYRVAAFCPGRVVELPGDTPKVEPEADNWCETLADASAWFGLYVDRECRDGWKRANVAHSKFKPSDAQRWNYSPPATERPSLHSDGHVGPVAKHAAQAAQRETSVPSIHDLLEAFPPARDKSAADKLARELNDATIFNHARAIVSPSPPPYYGYGDVGDTLVSYLRGERNARDTMQSLDYSALDYECARRRAT